MEERNIYDCLARLGEIGAKMNEVTRLTTEALMSNDIVHIEGITKKLQGMRHD